MMRALFNAEERHWYVTFSEQEFQFLGSMARDSFKNNPTGFANAILELTRPVRVEGATVSHPILIDGAPIGGNIVRN